MLLSERISKQNLLMFLANPELKLLPVANIEHGLSVEPETVLLQNPWNRVQNILLAVLPRLDREIFF